MHISDWSSDVCSSDLLGDVDPSQKEADVTPARVGRGCLKGIRMLHLRKRFYKCKFAGAILTMVSRTIADNECDRRSPCESKIGRASCRERVCQVRVDLGVGRIIKKTTKTKKNN